MYSARHHLFITILCSTQGTGCAGPVPEPTTGLGRLSDTQKLATLLKLGQTLHAPGSVNIQKCERNGTMKKNSSGFSLQTKRGNLRLQTPERNCGVENLGCILPSGVRCASQEVCSQVGVLVHTPYPFLGWLTTTWLPALVGPCFFSHSSIDRTNMKGSWKRGANIFSFLF